MDAAIFGRATVRECYRPANAVAIEATTQRATTRIGGARNRSNTRNPAAAIATSTGDATELFQIGLYSAAASTPTTAALTPPSAPRASGRWPLNQSPYRRAGDGDQEPGQVDKPEG